jgi:hypothetical protein
VRRVLILAGLLIVLAGLLLYWPKGQWFYAYIGAELAFSAGYTSWYDNKKRDGDLANTVFVGCQAGAFGLGLAGACILKGFWAGLGYGGLGWLMFRIAVTLVFRAPRRQRLPKVET